MTRSLFSGLFSAIFLCVAPVVSPPANAQAPANGYVQSLGGTVKSGFGLCWRTGYWTPQMATEECDPDLVPKQAPKHAFYGASKGLHVAVGGRGCLGAGGRTEP